MEKNLFESEKITTLFYKFTIPTTIAMIITGMQVIIDGIFIGNIIDSNAMASINIAQPFIQFCISLMMMVSIGTQSYSSLSLGNKNIKKAQNSFKTFLIITTIGSILMSIIGVTLSNYISKLLGASNLLIQNTSTYIKIISIFMTPMSLMFLFGFMARTLGKPDLYFKGMILSLFVNITLNYILIYKFNLGIEGAAIATGFSNSSAFLIVIWPMLNKSNVINIFVGKFDKAIIRTVLYNGSSEGINSIACAISSYLFNITFIRIAGEIGVSAFSIINYIGQFGTYIMFGIGSGIGPIISYNFGSNKHDRVFETLKLSYIVSTVIGFIIFSLLFIFSKYLITIFVENNDTLVNIASTGAKIYAFSFFINGINIVSAGYATSIGNAKSSIIISLSRSLIFIVIGITILPNLFSINGIWMCVPFAEFITLAISKYLVKKSLLEINTNKIIYI